jgi:hypothetical protein
MAGVFLRLPVKFVLLQFILQLRDGAIGSRLAVEDRRVLKPVFGLGTAQGYE